MKKQYLRISIATFFFAALIFGTSCSKKSSDDPKPATSTTTPPVATTKPAPPDTEKRKTVDAEDGTGRPPLTDIPVGAVTVKDQASQRADPNMASENITKLDNLTGKRTTSGRFTETTTTVFGWFISDFTINGTPYTDQQIYDNGLQQALFFNIDSSGYYWAFENKSKTWSWGTFGIDKEMTTMAFDFDDKWNPTEAYTIAKITDDRLVLTGKFDFDEDGKVDNVIIGLNGYDLSDDKYNGDMKTSPEEAVFLGTWRLTAYVDAATSNVTTNIQVSMKINQDGTWQTNAAGTIENGSWVIETIPGAGTSGATSSIFYLYASSYDSATSSIVVEKHLVYIENGEMVMVLQETTDADDQDSENDQYYFAR